MGPKTRGVVRSAQWPRIDSSWRIGWGPEDPIAGRGSVGLVVDSPGPWAFHVEHEGLWYRSMCITVSVYWVTSKTLKHLCRLWIKSLDECLPGSSLGLHPWPPSKLVELPWDLTTVTDPRHWDRSKPLDIWTKGFWMSHAWDLSLEKVFGLGPEVFFKNPQETVARKLHALLSGFGESLVQCPWLVWCAHRLGSSSTTTSIQHPYCGAPNTAPLAFFKVQVDTCLTSGLAWNTSWTPTKSMLWLL